MWYGFCLKVTMGGIIETKISLEMESYKQKFEYEEEMTIKLSGHEDDVQNV